MTEEKTCPADMAAKAAFEYDSPVTWEKFKALFPEDAEEKVCRQRSALRALAAMESTDKMRDAYNGNFNTGADPVKAFLLAAADEGDTE